MAVKELVQDMAAWDCGVEDFEELGTNISLHLFIENGVKPEYLPFPLLFPAAIVVV